MLELERLNTESFDELVEQAVRIAGKYDSDWNNFQAADPGMTLVDLFAWLKAIQHEYMSVILPESQRRFLALLDIFQRQARGAETVAAVSGAGSDLTIPAGSRWMAGQAVFENPRAACVLAARLTRVCVEGGGRRLFRDRADMDGSRFFPVFPGLGDTPAREPDGSMTLCLDGPVPPDRDFSLYVELHAQVSRNPVGEEPFLPMADVDWQVWTAEGWKSVRVVEDGTYAFLFSGLITLRHSGTMVPNEAGEYLLRCVLRRDGYDLPPQLSRVVLNGVRLRQQDTRVQLDRFSPEQPLVLDSFLGLGGRHRVFLRREDGWEETADFSCQTAQGRSELCLPRPHQGALVLSWAEGENIVLGDGAGFSGQTLPFPRRDALPDSLTLLVGERTPKGVRYHLWKRVEDFCSAGPFDRCFVADGENEALRFGDHQRGAALPKGTGNILISGLRTCLGRASNVKEGVITKLTGVPGGTEQLVIRQLIPAQGGEDAERPEDTAARAGLILRQGKKLVTEEDYLAAVRAAPGLCVENCRVLTGFDGRDDRRVTVVVRGPGRAAGAPLEAYEENIRRSLDSRRLLTTQIQVVWPQPVRLVITGQLVTVPHHRDSQAMVHRRIEEFLAQLNRTFGAPLSYGEFYCALDMLECVSRVEALTIEAVGERVVRTGTDNIVAPPNGFYELERLELNLIHSFL